MKVAKLLIAGSILTASSMAMASDMSATIDGNNGKEVQYSVESNPSTGYGWMIKSLPEELVFVSSDYQQSAECGKGAVGCSGTTVFTFIAQKRGKGKLTLIHGRAFDKTSWEEKTVSVNIK